MDGVGPRLEALVPGVPEELGGGVWGRDDLEEGVVPGHWVVVVPHVLWKVHVYGRWRFCVIVYCVFCMIIYCVFCVIVCCVFCMIVYCFLGMSPALFKSYVLWQLCYVDFGCSRNGVCYRDVTFSIDVIFDVIAKGKGFLTGGALKKNRLYVVVALNKRD